MLKPGIFPPLESLQNRLFRAVKADFCKNTECELPRIVISGMGLITPLGLSAWESFRSLLAGRTLPERLGELPTNIAPVDLVQAVGSVCVAQHNEIDPSLELAERAAREAAAGAGVPLEGLPTYIATSKGAVHALAKATKSHDDGVLLSGKRKYPEVYSTAAMGKSGFDYPLAVAMGPQQYLNYHLARRLKIRPVSHTVAACASSLTALHFARNDLQHRSELPDACMILTAEAALTPQFIYSYKRLGVLAKTTVDDYRQTPLNEKRGGFMLSEFGAAIVLRRLKPGEKPKAGEIELTDTGISAAGYDMIRSNPTMPELAHVAKKMFKGRQIDVIHPHATGTPDHDPAELAALTHALKQTDHNQDKIPLYAIKGALGHGLGAAGLVSLVTAGLSLQTGKLPPMPWIDQPLQVDDAPLHITAEQKTIARTGSHAAFAAGFGGHTAGVVITRH
ncbi:3-oxoacyl-[acyl-carrier-protein] synthase 2 [Poriferisphaera corsica]|uniref:3-oxoacyl-[acyl-carrier-protein] synthase 2 n=1 Tax=Poriferisphaera corsica TaxID=2528020 RepID=A0A517YWJ7_9BACT|nr:beta-ketoacyl synthase N-terminal-like domain-containing protein [Poriferisphaera corsica]QDU34603.1 3-oxoacyl-[acyl-carrier-protein] synthase 2 [Poriferisphaera corsica]